MNAMGNATKLELNYSLGKAIYALLIPILLVSGVAIYFASNPAAFPSKLLRSPFGSVLLIGGLIAWMATFWPVAIRILRDGITGISIGPTDVVVIRQGQAKSIGSLKSARVTGNFMGQCKAEILTEEQDQPITITNAMQTGDHPISGVEFEELLRMILLEVSRKQVNRG